MCGVRFTGQRVDREIALDPNRPGFQQFAVRTKGDPTQVLSLASQPEDRRLSEKQRSFGTEGSGGSQSQIDPVDRFQEVTQVAEQQAGEQNHKIDPGAVFPDQAADGFLRRDCDDRPDRRASAHPFRLMPRYTDHQHAALSPDQHLALRKDRLTGFMDNQIGRDEGAQDPLGSQQFEHPVPVQLLEPQPDRGIPDQAEIGNHLVARKSSRLRFAKGQIPSGQPKARDLRDLLTQPAVKILPVAGAARAAVAALWEEVTLVSAGGQDQRMGPIR